MVDTSDLSMFAAIVATGSLTAAGKQLGLSPAVVSKRLHRLEDQLGTRLVHRTTRQIGLTDVGQEYHDRIIELLAGLEEAENFITRGSDSVQGSLKISAPTGFGRMHLAPHLQKFMQANPELELNVVLSDRFVDVIGERFDVAIRIGSLPDSTLVARKLAPIRRVLCATPLYVSRCGVPVNLSELEDHACLATHNQTIWKLEGPEGAVNFKVTGMLQTNSSEVVREMLLSHAGIALRSTWDVGRELASERLQVVLPQYTGSRQDAVYAIYPTRNFLPAKVRVFVEFLVELFGPNPYWDQGLLESGQLRRVFERSA